MRIRQGDAPLGMQLVHSKRSINGTHFAKVLTNSINSPDPRSDPEAGRGCRLLPLFYVPCSPPAPPSQDPKARPHEVHRGPILWPRVPSAAPGGPCLVTPRTRRLHGQRGAFCSRPAREAPALIRLITVHMAAGRALAHHFPTAAKKAPQCGAENRAAIQLRPPARPASPSAAPSLSSAPVLRVCLPGLRGCFPGCCSLSCLSSLPVRVSSCPVSSLLPFLSVPSEALPVSLFPASLPRPGFNLPAHLWVHLGAQQSSGPSFSSSRGPQRLGSLNVRKPRMLGVQAMSLAVWRKLWVLWCGQL